MLSINTNLSSLIAQNSMKTSTDKLNQAIERMTTGFKINHAKDNAANYSISTDMTTKIGAYQVAEDNCAQGLDMIATVSESLSLIQDKLERLRALATQAGNGTYGAQSLKAINAEANALVDEIERQYNTTEYNGINLAKISTEESKFIKDIDRRDTSKMTTLASVAIDEALTSGTYSISTAEELAKLATMTNNGLIGAGTEFVLANDIDLQAWCDANSATGGWVPIGLVYRCTELNPTGSDIPFLGNFDGNGYKISNLTTNRSSATGMALFGMVIGSEIRNLALEDCNIIANNGSAALISYCSKGIIDNCYTTGAVDSRSSAGLIHGTNQCSIKNSYTSVKLNNTDSCGFFYVAQSNLQLENCHVVSSNSAVVTIFGTHNNTAILTFNNCTYNSYYDTIGKVLDWGYGLVSYNNIKGVDDYASLIKSEISLCDSSINLQVGVNSDTNSQIGMSIGYVLDNLNEFRNIGKSQFDYVSLIDSVMSSLSSKQTEYGAVQNRLESALDEISIKYENLVSSRSTLRDADIAKVSSTYIQQQILQQASATLMATANQSPAIALQLI